MLKRLYLTALYVSILLAMSCSFGDLQHNDVDNSEKGVGKYDDTILNIAYSSLNDGYPINTYEHFEASIGIGFNSLKTDLRLTADKKLVLCHDPGFVLNNKGKIINYNSSGNKLMIEDMTAEEIVALEHASKGEGVVCHPLLAVDYLSLCKEKNIIPYITVRNERMEETVDILFELLSREGMLEDAIINVFPPSVSTCDYIRKKSDTVYISYTVGEGEPVSIGLINHVSSLGNAFLCAHKQKLLIISSEIWSYADKKGVKLLGWGISDKEEYQTLIKSGCRGGQIVKKEVIL